MCVYVIMLIFVCFLCYYVYSVKSSWELVFIVIQKPNSNKVFLSYLILSYLILSYLILAEVVIFWTCTLVGTPYAYPVHSSTSRVIIPWWRYHKYQHSTQSDFQFWPQWVIWLGANVTLDHILSPKKNAMSAMEFDLRPTRIVSYSKKQWTLNGHLRFDWADNHL